MSTSGSRNLEDVKVGVRLKISALWVAVLLLFAYGDIFGFLAPGHIQEVMESEISGIEITQTFLFAVSVYIAIAIVMVVLSLVLAAQVSRWANMVLATLYVVSIVASAVGEDAYFVFLSVVEIALLVLLIRFAWAWPRTERTMTREGGSVV